jgi:hypothetical protein
MRLGHRSQPDSQLRVARFQLRNFSVRQDVIHGCSMDHTQDRKETPMDDVKPKEDPKVEDPATHFDKPNDVVHDVNLSLDEKKKRLTRGNRARASCRQRAAKE